jgi:hypothetical protein
MRKPFLLMLTAACILSVAAAAQEKKTYVDAIGNTKPTPLPPGGPTPRLADGHVDLGGVWFSGNSGRTLAWTTEASDEPRREDPVPFRPEFAAKLKAMSRTEIQMKNPGVNCMPKGVPGIFTLNPHPTRIVMLPGVFIQLVEAGNTWRYVHTDGRPHSEYPDPLFNGDETAHWEGDTLVIDSISIDERTWINGNAWTHSDELHVTERLRRPSLNYLEYQFTIDDPKVLTKPWTSGWRTFSLGKEDLIENYCTNNQNAEELQKLYEQETNKK